jgi:hypothetical protein
VCHHLKVRKNIEGIPLSGRFGIDITKTLEHMEGEDIEPFMKNAGLGTAIAGGPTCCFQGKTIPCFVCTSLNASISSQRLADMLKFIDSYHIFDRSNGKKPFLVLDGDHSRMYLPFWTTYMVRIMNGLVASEFHIPLISGRWRTLHNSMDASKLCVQKKSASFSKSNLPEEVKSLR